MLVVDGQTLDCIAVVYGVNQSSVSRWLDKARLKVFAEARRLRGPRAAATRRIAIAELVRMSWRGTRPCSHGQWFHE